MLQPAQHKSLPATFAAAPEVVGSTGNRCKGVNQRASRRTQRRTQRHADPHTLPRTPASVPWPAQGYPHYLSAGVRCLTRSFQASCAS